MIVAGFDDARAARRPAAGGAAAPPLIAPLLVSVVIVAGIRDPRAARRCAAVAAGDRRRCWSSVVIVPEFDTPAPPKPAKRLPPFPPLIVPLLVSVAIVPELLTRPRRRAAAKPRLRRFRR